MFSDTFTIDPLWIVLIVFLVIFLAKSIRIISPNQKGLVERLGNLREVKDSGIHIIIPFVDRLRIVDIRETAIDVPPQEVICADNVVVTVDCVVYLQVTDPVRAIYNVSDFIYAVLKLTQTNLRSLIGRMTLDETLSARETINVTLRKELDENTDEWGVLVKKVEVQRIDPPVDVVEAMHRQMKAERDKRALILEAEGKRQSAILEAEGGQQAQVLQAKGEREAHIQRAEGIAKAIELESKAAIEFFRDGAITKEQLNVMQRSLSANTKYVLLDSELLETVKGVFHRLSDKSHPGKG